MEHRPGESQQDRPPEGALDQSARRPDAERGPDSHRGGDQDPDAEERARADLMRRISAAGVTTLGQAALIAGSEPSPASPGAGEPDDYPWHDAARWSPADELLGEPVSGDRLDELFAAVPDEEVGSVDDLGWFGLLRHVGRPGGTILVVDGLGFRGGREFATEVEITAAWRAVEREYEAFLVEQRADREPEALDPGLEPADTTSGHHPQIWVGSVADHRAGRAHGVWLDATLTPAELAEDIAHMLRNGYTPNAREWAVTDYDDFAGLTLGEHPSLDLVSRIATGIAEHGEAFAHWASYTRTSAHGLAEFTSHYLGHYANLEACASHLLRAGVCPVDLLPDDLRDRVPVAITLVAEEIRARTHVTAAAVGGIHVFRQWS